ncbi:MAG: GNAT family N-acetyltransferase [Candidatus Spechtbacterales bacterium]
MNIEINKAKPADAEEMVAIKMLASFVAYVGDTHKITEEDMIVQCGPDAVDALEEGLASKKIRGWLVVDKDKGETIGASTAKIKKDKLIFSTMHLLPEYNGMDLGRMLINEMLKWADERKKDIFLYVVEYNKDRHNWYKRLGFQETTKKEWVLKSGKTIPRIEMVRRVKN